MSEMMRHVELDRPEIREATPPPNILADYGTRAETCRQAALDAGLAWPKTYVPENSALIQSGTDKLRSDRQRWASRPHIREGAKIVVDALAAQRPFDKQIKIKDLRMNAVTGKITSVDKIDKPGSAYSDHAFRQLIDKIPNVKALGKGAAGFLLNLSGKERAEILNARIASSEAKATLRGKFTHDGTPYLRAVLSERYGDIPDTTIAAALAASIDVWDARLDYKPGDDRSKFEVIFSSQVAVETFRVGDLHYVTLSIENSETGLGKYKIRGGLARAACYNLTLNHSEGTEVDVRHIGSTERVQREMRNSINQELAKIEGLIATIQIAAKIPMLDLPPSEIMKRIAQKFSMGENRASAWTETFERNYLPNKTLWSITSAITEAAQNQDAWWNTLAEEKVAAEVLNKQWVVLN